MQKYSILINGTNVFLKIDGDIGRYGFYTTRYVEAMNDKEASAMVMNLIKNELEAISLNNPDDPPILKMEEIDLLDSFGDIKTPGAGFSLYKEVSH